MELVYFAGMPLTMLILSVLYHMGYDILDLDHADSNAVLAIPLMIVLWPLVLFVFIAVVMCFCIWRVFDGAGKFIAAGIKKVWKPK